MITQGRSAVYTVVAAWIVAGVVAALAAPASAQDWPQWRGATRDGKVTGFTAPAAWPKELAQKWKVAVGAGDASPVLVGDRVYVFARQGGDEVTLCLGPPDGKPVWTDKNPVAAISGPDSSVHSGPRSTPAVSDGKVVTLGVTGVLSCLNAADGKVLWRKDDLKGWPQFHTASSPLIADGLVIAQLGGMDNGAIVAYDLATGAEKWKCPGAPAYASPVLLTADGVKQVVALTSKAVVGVGLADGKLLWQAPFVPAGRMDYNAATPVVDGATVYVTGAGQGRGTKALKVAKEGDAFAAKELWSSEEGCAFASPVVKDGLLYGINGKGNLFCLDAKDGKTAWTDTVARDKYGALLDAGGAILALPNLKTGPELVAFKPGKEYVELAKYKVADRPTAFGVPVVAGKSIFVKDQDSLILWGLE